MENGFILFFNILFNNYFIKICLHSNTAALCESVGDNQWAFHVAAITMYLSSAMILVCCRMKPPETFQAVDVPSKKIPDVESNMEAIDISVIDLPEAVGPPAA